MSNEIQETLKQHEEKLKMYEVCKSRTIPNIQGREEASDARVRCHPRRFLLASMVD